MDKQVLIHDLPEDADQILNLLSAMRKCSKHSLIREAIIEYTNKRRKTVAALMRKTNGG